MQASARFWTATLKNFSQLVKIILAINIFYLILKEHLWK